MTARLPDDEAVAIAPPVDPPWLRHAFDEARADVLAWLRTFWNIAVRPARFSRAWVDGESKALGPLAFIGASAAIAGVAQRLMGAWLGLHGADALWKEILDALAPYAYYAVVGLLAHLLLRPFFRLRRATSTLAISLFAGGAMPMLSFLLCVAMMPLLTGVSVTGDGAHADSQLALFLGLVPVVWFYVSLARALSGMHRLRGWVTGLVVLLLALATAFAPERLPIPVWHLHAEVRHQNGLSVGLSLTNY